MSTRSQVRFVETVRYTDDDGNDQETTRVAQVYRHSDGYPSGVLSALAQLKALQDATGTERDPSYVAANFIFLNKLQGMGLYVDGIGDRSITMDDVESAIVDDDLSGLSELGQPSFLLGYGVENPENGIHGDEEYLYVVDIGPTIQGKPMPGSELGDDSWTVKVSEHGGFPRWDGDTEAAFDVAEWAFEGSLEAAIEEFAATA